MAIFRKCSTRHGSVLLLATAAAPAHAAERLASNTDSWSALIFFLVIAALACGLAATRFSAHRTAVLGTGLLLIAGAIVLGTADLSGAFAQFRTPVTPLDPVKVPILRGAMIIAAVAGVFLLVGAVRMRPVAHDRPRIALRNDENRYGRVSRVLHWAIALIFVSMIPLGIFMSGLPEGASLRDPLYIVHKSLGMTVLMLVIVRICWYGVSRPPALSSDLSRANRIGAKAAHVLLYVLMLAFPVTGYFMSSYSGKIIPIYFLDLPPWVTPSKAHALPFGALHKFALPILFYLVFVAHVAGVLKHHFVDRHKDAIRRMTG